VKRFLGSMFALFLCFALSAAQGDPVPPFHVPGGFAMTPGRFAQFDTAKFEYPATGKTERIDIEGRVWQFWLGSDARPVSDPAVTAPRIAAALQHDGWSVVRHDAVVVARKDDTWFSGYGNSGSFKVTIAQRGSLPRPIALTPPSTVVENLPDDSDFPWFTRFLGAKLRSTRHGDRPIEITRPDAKEASFSGPTITKYYDTPGDVSSFEFVTTYHRALAGAGWAIVREAIGGDGLVLAHFTKSGRDLWLLTHIIGTGQSVSIADTGADTAAANLKHALESVGHVAVYGIYFDSDSATPKAESGATLQHILTLLNETATMRLEIQGHTDDTGSVPHNQLLSEQRATSVRSWLVTHAIVASRLESHGYGSARPIADNKTPEGKAKNRRVELVVLH
jgi:OmpA-OmpF porin, OOP family